MKPIRAAVLAVVALALMAQAKPVLVPDVSARRIEIRYSFTGAQLLLFGAILYPRGVIPERTPDIAVVLRGPVEPILVQRHAGPFSHLNRVFEPKYDGFRGVLHLAPKLALFGSKRRNVFTRFDPTRSADPSGARRPECHRRRRGAGVG